MFLLEFLPDLVAVFNEFLQIRIFNYNTLERQHAYEAHSDYVRSIAVHPTQVHLDLENALLAVVC